MSRADHAGSVAALTCFCGGRNENQAVTPHTRASHARYFWCVELRGGPSLNVVFINGNERMLLTPPSSVPIPIHRINANFMKFYGTAANGGTLPVKYL